MMPSDQDSFFNAFYYREGCGRQYQRDNEWLNFFDGIAEKIVQEINPRTVLDAGCAMGFLVEGLRKRGVDAYGIDISEYAISQAHESIELLGLALPMQVIGQLITFRQALFEIIIAFFILALSQFSHVSSMRGVTQKGVKCVD